LRSFEEIDARIKSTFSSISHFTEMVGRLCCETSAFHCDKTGSDWSSLAHLSNHSLLLLRRAETRGDDVAGMHNGLGKLYRQWVLGTKSASCVELKLQLINTQLLEVEANVTLLWSTFEEERVVFAGGLSGIAGPSRSACPFEGRYGYLGNFTKVLVVSEFCLSFQEWLI
jgi:hypothetical protein